MACVSLVDSFECECAASLCQKKRSQLLLHPPTYQAWHKKPLERFIRTSGSSSSTSDRNFLHKYAAAAVVGVSRSRVQRYIINISADSDLIHMRIFMGRELDAINIHDHERVSGENLYQKIIDIIYVLPRNATILWVLVYISFAFFLFSLPVPSPSPRKPHKLSIHNI